MKFEVDITKDKSEGRFWFEPSNQFKINWQGVSQLLDEVLAYENIETMYQHTERFKKMGKDFNPIGPTKGYMMRLKKSLILNILLSLQLGFYKRFVNFHYYNLTPADIELLLILKELQQKMLNNESDDNFMENKKSTLKKIQNQKYVLKKDMVDFVIYEQKGLQILKKSKNEIVSRLNFLIEQKFIRQKKIKKNQRGTGSSLILDEKKCLGLLGLDFSNIESCRKFLINLSKRSKNKPEFILEINKVSLQKVIEIYKEVHQIDG